MKTDYEPLFQVRAETGISAPPDVVYAIVTDLSRSGEWSPECTGGKWITGIPGTVGAIFQGDNRREMDVVAWAPVVRGTWSTTCEVVAAEPGRIFSWAMRDSSGRRQDSVWTYEFTGAGDGGCRLVHRFRMGAPTEGIRSITAGLTPADRRRFFADWSGKLADDLATTLARIKTVIETSGTGPESGTPR
ncbi:SRPBCC family protein [Plantactinospora sp. KLBMP9567]|uniref:SRPBCC family protein n=1 Tax=Plantactinospora sp. KLBMP9567 TaxID=3085900 RepID=UPI0029820FEA|nr:SRPBCC family protein [Plantactinospora sp. KLBMP9567]MDW5328513.1 SRPBCC family protein [Plantactinospora sp. KLBMP9567]